MRSAPCWDAAEEDSGDHGRGDSEQENGNVHANVGLGEQRTLRQKHQDALEKSPGESHAESSTNGRERKAFDQELTKEARDGGPNGGANSDFFLPAGTAGEQQIGDVGAGDQEDKGNGAH